MKTCSHCQTAKPHSEYHRDKRGRDGLARKCKACVAAYQEQWRDRERENIATRRRAYREANRANESARHRAWVAKNRESNVAYHRDWALRRKYGLSAAEWDAMFEAQGRACAICGDTAPHTRRGWHTDHCHALGHVRGILCHHCNLALGHIKDSPELALKLVEYLSR